MSWNPKYVISDRLLSTIREIGQATGEIKSLNLSNKALAKLELSARELSTFASTSIEGNPLPLTDVKQVLKSNKDNIRDTEREVLNYNAALQNIYKAVSSGSFKLSISILENTQKQVVDGLLDNPSHCGHVRQDAVIIRNPRNINEIVFQPPEHKDVKPLLVGLLAYINANISKIDPIILAGIFHRQHVIIHPFMDGNGRTTRLITTAILGMSGLDLFEIFSFENYYNNNITRYFKAVGLHGDYYDLQDDIDFTHWLEYFAEGILDELKRVQKSLPLLAATQPRLEPHHKQILAYIKEHGSITQREYSSISERSLASRKLDFEKLLGLGLITKKSTGRGVYYV